MKANEFVKKCIAATKIKTLYVMGGFGAPLNSTNKARYTANHTYNEQQHRKNKILSADSETFGFDCCGLIKGILWGFNADNTKVYGGAYYKANGVPDIGADRMIQQCSNVSTNMGYIKPGELVWMSGHIGVYIGNGDVVECTPIIKDGVQIIPLRNRGWKKHGQFNYIDYTENSTDETLDTPKLSINEVALKVVSGDYGNGKERFEKLEADGYDSDLVQEKVNQIMANRKKSNEEVAREVIQGKYGNGEARKLKLKAMGYDYYAIQGIVNKMYGL